MSDPAHRSTGSVDRIFAMMLIVAQVLSVSHLLWHDHGHQHGSLAGVGISHHDGSECGADHRGQDRDESPSQPASDDTPCQICVLAKADRVAAGPAADFAILTLPDAGLLVIESFEFDSQRSTPHRARGPPA